tara:strand:+ start:770 stop:1657 length:888 start_codon:yes stop_codon:yes gene_type:complete
MDNEFYISQSNWNKIINYAGISYDEFKAEIGGMSVMIEDEDGDWELKDPVILKQVVTAGNTHLDKDELAKYYTRTAKKYAKKNFRFCWWHSHHTMDAFWSGTDTNTIDEFSDGDFSFALVVNLKEEYKFRVSIWKPFPMHKDVELSVICNEKKFPKKLVDEVNELCSKPEPPSYLKAYKSNQKTLWHQQVKGNNVINYTTVADEPVCHDFTYAYELMTKLINGACAGTVKYEEYLKSIKEFNDKATEEQTGILIGKLSKKDWEASLMTSTPANHIVDTEMEAFNESFDYHSRWGI